MTDERAGQPSDQPERPGGGREPAGSDPTGAHEAAGEVADEGARRPARAATGESPVRRCGFSHCRKPLPDEPRADGRRVAGKKSEYCPKEVTAWDADGVIKTCGQMARAERDLAAVTGARAVADLNVVELGEHIAAVLGPVQAVLAPVTALTEALTGVRDQLEGAVATARAEQQDALRRAAEADGRADAQRQLALEAEAAAAAATERADAAERAARADRAARDRAERDQATAEGRASELTHALVGATERVDALTARADDLERRVARANGELDSARQALEEERQRANGHEERAHAAIAAAADRERELLREFDHRLDQLRAEQQHTLDQARADYARELDVARRDANDALQRAREQAAAARHADRQAEADRHARAQAELHERIGGLRQELSAATARAEQAAAQRQALRRIVDSLGPESELLRTQMEAALLPTEQPTTGPTTAGDTPGD